jgi:hypothetical protein
MIATQTVTDISTLSEHSRVWVFQSSKLLQGDMRTEISSALIAFLKDWAAHGKSLFAAFDIKFDRFILIAVDEAMAQATGCSVDKLMKTIQAIDAAYSLDLLNRMKVAYRSGEEIIECDVNTFTQMLKSGEADESTFVFNNVVQNLAEFNSNWDTKVSHSWHANLLP